jgi:signal transduction histidine kinase
MSLIICKYRFMRHLRIFIVYILSFNFVNAQSVIHINKENQIINISKYSYYYEDKTGKNTLENILLFSQQGQFKPCKNEIINFGNSKSILWIKFTLQNNTPDLCVVEILKPHMGYVSFFEPTKNNEYVEKIAGAFIPIENKDYEHNYIWFRLDKDRRIKVNTPVTYYLKLSSPNKTAPLLVGTEKMMFNAKGKIDMFYGICFGIFIMVILYNLFMYFSIKETVYFLYLLYVFFVGLSNAILVGYMPSFLTNKVINVSFHVQTIMAISALLLSVFSMKFLETAKRTPRANYIFYFFIALELMTIFFDFTKQYYYGSMVIQFFTMGSAAFLLPVSISIYLQGNKVIRFYILAWLIGWIGILSYILAINSLIPFNFFTHNGVLIGSIFETILFSLALADKINFIKKETEEANKRTLKVILENDKLIKQQNEQLEKQVLERTTEIKQKNIELQKYSEKLESIVDVRTEQIKLINNELTLQNKRLEQYTFVTSHNIRGPVARLLGLIYLLKRHTIIREEQEQLIIHKLEESTLELDAIIKDISKLLDIDRELNNTKEIILFDELVKHVLLSIDIPEKISIDLVTDFSRAKSIYTIRPFIYSILYNLISNAIKFRDANRPIKITVNSNITNDTLIVSVSDNGRGMDLNAIGEKIFKPYQRFNTQEEGKGFGLFIVKTQVEALDGKISVESVSAIGTTFTFSIPQNGISETILL